MDNITYFKLNGEPSLDLDSCDYVGIKLCGKHAKEKCANAFISKHHLPIVLEFKWYLGKDGYPVTYQSIDGKIKLGRGMKMHKMISPKISEGMVIDHVNRNKLDNRIENLRICTQKQNSYNTTKPKNSSSKYKGVKKEKNGSWTASISKDGKTNCIKGIDNEIDAAKIYDMMAEDLFGNYAGKNF